MEMKRLVMMAVAVGATIAATAMPTRKDLAKAQEMVADVTAADVVALKAGTKKPAEVAAKHMELAGQAGSEAEKYLLLQGAFRLFVKGEDYENAAKAIETMQAEIKDFNPEVIVELCGKAFVRKMQENAPRLYALKENARRIVFYRRQLPIREAAVRKTPKDPQAQRKLAECHAELGDWSKALDVFVKAGGEFKKMAEGETSGKIPAQELGDFWWDYETKSDTFVYKLHAAELYRKALADDSFKGLARTRAEQRAKEVEKDTASMVACSSKVISSRMSLKAGESLVKLAGFPNRTFDLGCERKLEMIACPAGTFTMGEKTVAGDCNEVRKHQVKITRPFWLSKVAVTRAQWRKLMYGNVEGEKENPQYEFAAVNSALSRKRAFMGALNNRFKAELPEGYVFRLPTEAELAYAMTSGGRDKVTELSVGVLGPSEQDKEKVIQELTAKGVELHKAGKDQATKVGMAKPNTWGFYDIINNGHPEVLDIVAPNSRMRKMKRDDKGNYLNISYEDFETDPLCWDEGEKDVAPLHCDQARFWVRRTLGGWGWNEVFRVCLGPDLVAEKKAIQESGNRQAEKAKADESEKATGDDGWEWVIPMDIHDGWRMTMDEPHAKWLSADYTVPDDWKKILGRVDIGYGDRTHKRWLRTDIVWKGDWRKVEKAEIVSVVNDVAHIWIDGYEAVMHLRGGGNRDITSVFKATIGKGRKVPVCVNIVDECGEGYLEFGIRVKMKK